MTDQEERVVYLKALAEMLETLPVEETVDRISLDRNCRSDFCGRVRVSSPSWVVTTVVPDGKRLLRRTFWRSYLDLDTNRYKLANVGSDFLPQ